LQTNRKLAAAAAEKAVQARKKSSDGHYCPAEGCNRFFMSAVWLVKHQNARGMCPDASTSPFRSSAHSGKKGSGVTPVHVSANDLMKRIIADTSKGMAVHEPGSAADLLAADIDMDMDGTSIGNGQYVLIDGSNFECPAAPVGMAEKKHKKGGNQRFVAGQLTFMGWCYMRGVKHKADKMSPKQAADAMEIHGTTAGATRYPNDPYCARRADGKPTFRIGELLEHWTFRSWFGQQKAAFEKKLAAAHVKAAPDFNSMVAHRAVAGDDEDEEEDAEL
jgi:hypothetical protein